MSPKAIKSTTLHTVPAQVQWCYFFHVAAVAPEWWKFLFLRDRQRNECGRSNSRTTPLRPPNPTLQPRFWELSVVGTVMFLGTPGKPTKPLRWRSCLRLRADSHRFVTFWHFLFKCFGPLPRTHSRRWKFLAKFHALKSLDFPVVLPILVTWVAEIQKQNWINRLWS